MSIPNTAPLLDVRGVTLQYKTRDHLVTATYRVDFQVFPSDRFVLLGPSGCGKSTLLKAVGGYMAPVEGDIFLRGERITRPGPDRMMVFQEFDQLLPWKTVKQNVVFPLMVSGRAKSRKEAEEKALDLLDKVRLTKFVDSYPHTLSGGMKQRVAIARTLVNNPRIVLMDEPFGALDPQTRWGMQSLLLNVSRVENNTILFVTHDVSEAVYLADAIYLLSSRPARILHQVDVPAFAVHDIALKSAPEFRNVEKKLLDLIYAPPGKSE